MKCCFCGETIRGRVNQEGHQEDCPDKILDLVLKLKIIHLWQCGRRSALKEGSLNEGYSLPEEFLTGDGASLGLVRRIFMLGRINGILERTFAPVVVLEDVDDNARDFLVLSYW